MKKKINLLSISFDHNIADQKFSDARDRQIEYSHYFKNYKVIILNKKSKPLQAQETDNLKVIPTNSKNIAFSIITAIKLALLENKKTPFELITAQDPMATGMVGIALKKILNIPLNIQMHIDYQMNPYWLKERLINKIYSFFIDWELKNADSIRIVNKGLFKKIENRYPRLKASVFFTPVFVDIDYFFKKVRRKNKIEKLVSVGRLVKQKNFPLLIKAFKKVNQKYPNTSLAIAGEGKGKDKLIRLIKRHNLSKKVTLKGMLSRKRIKKLLHSSDLFVLASNHEGWGIVYVEALAAGLPIVTTRVESQGDLIKDGINSLISPVGNSQKLAENIIELIEYPDKARSLSKNGQKEVVKVYKKQKLINYWVKGLYETKKRN